MDTPGPPSLGPVAPARRDVRRRHAAADRVRLAARRPRVQLHAHRRHRSLPAHARPQRLLPDGLGRQRAAHRAPRAELLPRPLRRARGLRAGADARAGHQGVREAAAPARLAPQLHRAVRRAHAPGRGGVQDALASPRALRRLGAGVRDHRCPLAPARAALLPRPVREGPRLHRRGADDVGRRFPDRRGAGRGRGPRDARAPSTTSRSPSRAATRASPSPRRAPSCSPPASA